MLLATPTVRRATSSDWWAKHAANDDKWCDVDPVKPPPGFKLDNCYETSNADKGQLHWVLAQPWEQDWSKKQPAVGQIGKPVYRLESFAPEANPDGITLIHYDVREAVTIVELATGEKIYATPRPSLLQIFVVPLLISVIGFLVPWGLIKTISWVVTGFAASKSA